MQAGGQVAVLLYRQAHVEEAVHRREEAVGTVVLAGETELGQAADDFFFQFVLGGDFGLQEQILVLLQQCRQFVAAQAATVEHGQRVAALVGQVLDEDEGEQRQTLGGLVDLRAHLFRHEVIEAAAVAHQFIAERLEQGAIGVLLAGQLGVQLGRGAADVVALEQLAEDRRQLGEFFQVDIHTEGVPAGLIRA